MSHLSRGKIPLWTLLAQLFQLQGPLQQYIIHHPSEEKDIRVLHWRQQQEEKPEGGTEFTPGIRRNAQFWKHKLICERHRWWQQQKNLCGGFSTHLSSEWSPTMLSHNLTCKRNWCIFIQGDQWWVQNDCVVVLCYDSVIWSLNPWLVLVHWKTVETIKQRLTFNIIIWITNP